MDSSSLGVGLTIALLSMLGTLLALALVAAFTWALGRYLRDPEPAETPSGR